MNLLTSSKACLYNQVLSLSLMLSCMLLVLSTAHAQPSAAHAQPFGAHIRPFAYVGNAQANSVSVIDTRTNRLIGTVPVGERPNGVAASPDGAHIYVTNYL